MRFTKLMALAVLSASGSLAVAKGPYLSVNGGGSRLSPAVIATPYHADWGQPLGATTTTGDDEWSVI